MIFRMFFVVLLAVTLCTKAHANDILSCKEKRYEAPGICDNEVKVSLACPVKKRCRLIPSCKPLNKERYKEMYNQALFFGYGVLDPATARIALISEVLTAFYKINPKNFNISVVDDRSMEWKAVNGDKLANWADYHQVHGAGQKPALIVSEDTLWRSPAFLVSILGHEMVHYEQDQRKMEGINFTGLDYAMVAFYELEASSWEINATPEFQWKLGHNKIIGCLKGTEPEEPKLTWRCREWQTKNAIEKLRTLPMRSNQRMAELKKWLEQNPWTNQIWLPKNSGWQNYRAGPKPAECKDFN